MFYSHKNSSSSLAYPKKAIVNGWTTLCCVHVVVYQYKSAGWRGATRNAVWRLGGAGESVGAAQRRRQPPPRSRIRLMLSLDQKVL